MPFTLSHPAAILPLRRRGRWPLSALVIGAMAPDFPYFLFIHNDLYHFGHLVRGVFLFCLPAGLLVFVAFHGLLKMPALSLLPVRHQRRLYPVARYAPGRRPVDWLWIAAGIVVGAFSHLLWDSFTHGNGWMVRHLPFLALTAPHLQAIPFYKALQYSSSIVGAAILAKAYAGWYRSAPPAPEAELPHRLAASAQRRLFLTTAVVAILCASLYTASDYHALAGYESPKRIVAEFVETIMTTFAAGLVVFSLRWHQARHRAAEHP